MRSDFFTASTSKRCASLRTACSILAGRSESGVSAGITPAIVTTCFRISLSRRSSTSELSSSSVMSAGEIHGAGRLGRDDGVKAAAAQQYLEMRFISRREDDEEHRRQHYQPKRSGYESRTPKERGRQIAERQGKRGVRVSVQFRGHGSYSKADHTRRALWELARF